LLMQSSIQLTDPTTGVVVPLGLDVSERKKERRRAGGGGCGGSGGGC